VALFHELKETLASILFLTPNLPNDILPMDVKIKTLDIETRNMYPIFYQSIAKAIGFCRLYEL
jgi:hypothetical protein